MGIKLASGNQQPGPQGQRPFNTQAPFGAPQQQQQDPTKTWFRRILTWSRWSLAGITLFYALGIVLYVLLVEYDAEDHHLTSVAMYMPQFYLLLPLLILTPLCLLIWARLILIHLLVVAGVAFFFMDYVWSGPRIAAGPTVSVVVNNIGQSHGKSIMPFVKEHEADIVVLSDAVAQGLKYKKAFEEEYGKIHYIRGDHQFLIISKYPIVNGGLLDMQDERGDPIAAWYEVDVNGYHIYVFALHLPTPRDELNAVRGFAFLGTLTARLGKEGHATEVYKRGKEFFAHQLALGEKMVEFTKEADKPFIVCGDFNVPTHGKTYHLFKRNWVEAFAAAGKGYGYTFPGDAKFPPWLRLDNIYCSHEGLTPVTAVAESGRSSQHRSMFAEFEMPVQRVD